MAVGKVERMPDLVKRHLHDPIEENPLGYEFVLISQNQPEPREHRCRSSHVSFAENISEDRVAEVFLGYSAEPSRPTRSDYCLGV